MTDTSVKPAWGASERRDNQLVSDERVISIIPKNRSIEQRVTVKKHQTRKDRIEQRFIDIREWWFKFGATEEPIPTGKGTMVHRAHVPKLVLALLGELDPEEFSPEQLGELETQIARIVKGR